MNKNVAKDSSLNSGNKKETQRGSKKAVVKPSTKPSVKPSEKPSVKKPLKKTVTKLTKKPVKKAVKKVTKRKSKILDIIEPTHSELIKESWETRRNPKAWKKCFLKCLESNPLNIGNALRKTGIARTTYRDAMADDADFREAFEDLQSDATDILKARAFRIANGNEDDVIFVGKEGRKESVPKDGQQTLRWMLEGLEPQTFNQRAIEARGSVDIKDPIIIMPDLFGNENEVKITHVVEEASVNKET